MKTLKNLSLVLTLIISLTLLSEQLNALFYPTLQSRIEQGQLANILLIGSDARPGEMQTRGDTIMLLSINPALNKAALISIPRDTRITYRGQDTKINMVNQVKGPETLCQEVGKLLNTRVDHYVVTDFAGFEEIIDLFGGVYVNVEVSVHNRDVYLEKGYQHLNGKEALAYARHRANPDMDIGRVQRQQRLLLALYQQMMQVENLTLLPQLVPQLKEHVHTNISFKDLLYLARQAAKFKDGEVIPQTLPGYHYFAPYSGASYWEVDRKISRGLLKGLFDGQQYDIYLPAPPGTYYGN